MNVLSERIPRSLLRGTSKSNILRGCGAVGSVLEWHSRGQGFESPQLHQPLFLKSIFLAL